MSLSRKLNPLVEAAYAYLSRNTLQGAEELES